jgi:hypothetical protein
MNIAEERPCLRVVPTQGPVQQLLAVQLRERRAPSHAQQ